MFCQDSSCGSVVLSGFSKGASCGDTALFFVVDLVVGLDVALVVTEVSADVVFCVALVDVVVALGVGLGFMM